MKVLLYHFGAISDDVETQRKGLVTVFSATEEVNEYFFDKNDQLANATFMATQPLRFSGMHMSLPHGYVFRMIEALMVLELFTKSDRVRTKFYPGGLTMENQYRLMTYGIPVRGIPVTSTGTIKTKNHLLWLKHRRIFEMERAKDPSIVSSWVDVPNVNDVLFRAGGGNSHHYGNIEFEQTVEMYLPAYNATNDRTVKKDIRNEVIELVKSNNGRFLEMNKKHGRWEEITEVTSLHDKLYAFFYQHKRRLENQSDRQNNNSDTSRFIESNKRRKLVTNGGGSSCCFG